MEHEQNYQCLKDSMVYCPVVCWTMLITMCGLLTMWFFQVPLPIFGASLGVVYACLGLFVLFVGFIIIDTLRSRVDYDHRGTLLLMAILRDDMKVFRHVLPDCTASEVNQVDEKGLAPLGQAVYHQRINMEALLLDHGADPIQPNADGDTILHLAVKSYSASHQRLLSWLRSRFLIERRDHFTNLKVVKNNRGETAWDLFKAQDRNITQCTYKDVETLLCPEENFECKPS